MPFHYWSYLPSRADYYKYSAYPLYDIKRTYVVSQTLLYHDADVIHFFSPYRFYIVVIAVMAMLVAAVHLLLTSGSRQDHLLVGEEQVVRINFSIQRWLRISGDYLIGFIGQFSDRNFHRDRRTPILFICYLLGAFSFITVYNNKFKVGLTHTAVPPFHGMTEMAQLVRERRLRYITRFRRSSFLTQIQTEQGLRPYRMLRRSFTENPPLFVNSFSEVWSHMKSNPGLFALFYPMTEYPRNSHFLIEDHDLPRRQYFFVYCRNAVRSTLPRRFIQDFERISIHYLVNFYHYWVRRISPPSLYSTFFTLTSRHKPLDVSSLRNALAVIPIGTLLSTMAFLVEKFRFRPDSVVKGHPWQSHV